MTNENTNSTWEPRTDLASTANGLGASMVGIEDAAGHYTATTVEGALAEISAGSATLPYCFTYRQGGVASGNVFTTFLAAYTAAKATGTHCEINIDDSLGSAVTGSCGLIDLTNIDLVGPDVHPNRTTLTFQTGTTVSRFRDVTNLALASTSTSVICTIGTVADTQQAMRLLNSTVTGGSVTHFFNVVNGGGTNYLSVYLEEWSFMLNSGSNRAVQIASGTYLFTYLFDASGYSANAFGGAGFVFTEAFSPACQNGTGGALPLTQVNVSGGYSITTDSLASQMAYTDAAPLLSATTVQAAIDAVKLKTNGLKYGSVTLVSGTATVSTLAVTASSRIVCSLNTPGGTLTLTTGYFARGANRSVGSPGSFTVEAHVAAGTINTADTSVVDYIIIG